MCLQAREGGPPEPPAGGQPAGELAGQRGLALAPLAPEHDEATPGLLDRAEQQPLGGQQLPAPAHEAVRRRLGHGTERELVLFLDLLPHPLGRHLPHQLRVGLLLEEHGHEPVLEPQLAAEAAAAVRIVVQRLLPGQHRLADPFALEEGLVEGADEPPRRLDEHGVAHRRHRRRPSLEQRAGHRRGGVGLGVGRLAGLQEEERHAPILDQSGQLLAVNRLAAAARRASPGRRDARIPSAPSPWRPPGPSRRERSKTPWPSKWTTW